MTLSIQPKDIENYELKHDKVKILRTRYDPISGQFLGIDYCVGLITFKNDSEEQFFDYRYNKDNFKMLHSTKKLRFQAALSELFLEFLRSSMRVVHFLKKVFLKYFFTCLRPLTEVKKLTSI